jgi:hypothetical protein
MTLSKKTKQRLALAAFFLLMLWLLGFSFYRFRTRYKEARAEVNRLSGPEGQKLSPEQKDQRLNKLREKLDRLSFQQLTQLIDESEEPRRAQIRRFFTLSPEEQRDMLDQEIERTEQFRQFTNQLSQAMAEARAELGAGTGGAAGMEGGNPAPGSFAGSGMQGGTPAPGPFAGPGTGGMRSPTWARGANGPGYGPGWTGGLVGGASPGTANGIGGANGMGGVGPNINNSNNRQGPGEAVDPFTSNAASRTPEQRNVIKRSLLDASHPADRARLALYTQMMLQRKQQRSSQPARFAR